ncbi:hypothetical protein EXD76_04045 [BEV proteobacterium]|nr:hypothetical protein [Candidatus Symbiopectobacterium sp. Chty_BC]
MWGTVVTGSDLFNKARKCLSPQVYCFLMKPNCMILRCEDPSFHWAASIKSVYSTKPVLT